MAYRAPWIYLRTCLLFASAISADGFHDCVQPKSRRGQMAQRFSGSQPCQGGLCVGMRDGPHEGGAASYPVGDASVGFTSVLSTVTVPKPPKRLDGITYYIWTDIFFGDMSSGRMNQFVPQLMLGSALDGSTGPPSYIPEWHTHDTWAFGSHYFFETYNETSGKLESHAAYGELFPARVGETLFTAFDAAPGPFGPFWKLTMGVIGDPRRVSRLKVDQPYMGLGVNWTVPTTSWSEVNYSNLCINACWELYGANDPDHLPGSGATYNISISQGSDTQRFPWVTKWDQDEGSSKKCPASEITESHKGTAQTIQWDIFFPRDVAFVV